MSRCRKPKSCVFRIHTFTLGKVIRSSGSAKLLRNYYSNYSNVYICNKNEDEFKRDSRVPWILTVFLPNKQILMFWTCCDRNLYCVSENNRKLFFHFWKRLGFQEIDISNDQKFWREKEFGIKMHTMLKRSEDELSSYAFIWSSNFVLRKWTFLGL